MPTATNNHTTISESPEVTMGHAAGLAQLIAPGSVIALHGELGSGKTCWVKGFAAALDIKAPVSSPTFTVVNEYQTERFILAHIDAYRLHSADEAVAIGIDEYMCAENVTVIEWAERISSLLPPHTINIYFRVLDNGFREIRLQQDDSDLCSRETQ